MTTLGPADNDFATLANVAYRALRRANIESAFARAEAESFAYAAAELLAGRVVDAQWSEGIIKR